MNKRWIRIAAEALLAIALVGIVCLILGGFRERTIIFHEEDRAGSDSPRAEYDLEGMTIGICMADEDDGYQAMYGTELVRYLEGCGATVRLCNGRNDQEEQTNQVINLLTEGVDELVVSLVLPSSSDQITDLCASAAVPVVYINQAPSDIEQRRWTQNEIMAAYVGPNAINGGQLQGKIILEQENAGDLNNDGVIQYGILEGETDARETAIMSTYPVDALLDAGRKTEKVLELLNLSDLSAIEDPWRDSVLPNLNRIDVLICGNDQIALKTAELLEESGYTVGEDLLLIGAGASPESCKAVEEGRITGTLFNDYIAQTGEVARLLSTMSDGQENGTVTMYDYLPVTGNNVSSVMTLFDL